MRNDLFPTPEMILSVSCEFGIPLTAEDFGGELMMDWGSWGLGVSVVTGVVRRVS